jgi:hypothetical protein
MSGDDKARFCKTCQENVFNISMMTREEAGSLILKKEGNLCVRFAQREDGTIITDDCPVGSSRTRFVHQPWQALRYFAALTLAVIVAVINGEAKPIKKAKRQTIHAKKARTPIAEKHRWMGGGISFCPPTPTPTPRPVTIIRGSERQNEPKTPSKELTKVATKVQPKVIQVAPFKAPPKSDK